MSSSSIAAMNRPLWDPSNLLQITSDADGYHGEIQCVGETRMRSSRCRWTIADPALSLIRPLLLDMSCKKPGLVTKVTLRRLAALCLCPSYHSHQVESTVERWTRVVEKASQHHKNLLASARMSETTEGPLNSTPMDLKQIELKKSEAACAQYKSALATEQKKMKQESALLRAQIDGLRNQVLQLEEQNDKSRQEIRTSESTISQLQKLNRDLMEKQSRDAATGERTQKEIVALRTALVQANDRVQASQSDHQVARADLDVLKTDQAARLEEINVLKKQVNNLNTEVDTRRKAEEELVAERAAQATDLQRQLVQLGDERRYKLDLEKRLVNLELSIAALKESISRCLMHRFWGWAARLETRIRQIFRPLSTRGKAEDEIALKHPV